jgi:hypothetical protein
MVNEPLSNTAGNTYKSSSEKVNWIDLFHGALYDEDNVVLENPGKYDVKVYIDGVAQPISTYVVNYKLGTVTFTTIVVGVVTASYYYSDKSYYTLRPKVGEILSINRAEVQFSSGTQILAPFIFEIWADIVHPTYGPMTVPYPGTKNTYKNAKDFISACNLGQGTIPPWNELLLNTHVFPFDYVRKKPIKYSQNVEIRVYCRDHLPVTNCEFATATFYVSLNPEVV